MMKTVRAIFVMIFMAFLLGSCAHLGTSDGEKEFSFVSWNAQTFFDAQKDGCEYSEYQKPGWTKDKYEQRLERLCSVITTLNADVYAFEELENAAVMQDIANHLSGNVWGKGKNWNYACFSKTDGTAIGCGVLSVFPIKGVSVHATDIRTQKTPQPSQRPLLEVTVDVRGRDVVVMVNHWKSKLGDTEKTEIWRDWQESVMAVRLHTLSSGDSVPAVILCGDFNRNADDFALVQRTGGNTVLRGAGTGFQTAVLVQNLWFDENGAFTSDIGSYFYKDEWEHIDNIFLYGGLHATDFSPQARQPWAGEGGVPISYTVYNGRGYSDHLPLKCIVRVSAL